MSEDELSFEPPTDGGIVVGVDGSERGDRALRWAVAEARLRSLPVHAIRAWSFAITAAEVEHPYGVMPSFDTCTAAVRAELADEVAAALQGVGSAPVVHQHVLHVDAGQALARASEAAELVVVGDLGHSGLLGLLLGSVADYVLRHASCPVVVVRGE